MIIYRFCKSYGLSLPRRYMRKARKERLTFAKARKHSGKQIRKAVKKQLSYVRRALKYLDRYMSDGYVPVEKEIPLLLTIMKLYEQQLYMYEARTHSVEKQKTGNPDVWSQTRKAMQNEAGKIEKETGGNSAYFNCIIRIYSEPL